MVDKNETKEPWGQFTISSYLTIYHPRSRVLHDNYQKNYIAPSLTSQHIIYHFVGSGQEGVARKERIRKTALVRKMKGPTRSARQPPTHLGIMCLCCIKVFMAYAPFNSIHYICHSTEHGTGKPKSKKMYTPLSRD